MRRGNDMIQITINTQNKKEPLKTKEENVSLQDILILNRILTHILTNTQQQLPNFIENVLELTVEDTQKKSENRSK